MGLLCLESEAFAKSKLMTEMWELKVARILREVLVAGSKRDWDRIIELAQELEALAKECRDGKFREDEG
ncbi:hypothetical protein ES703_113512 [subsurface metagenome]